MAQLRRHERARLQSLGRASRLEVLRRYLLKFRAGEAKERKLQKVRKKRKHANTVARAVQECPELVEAVPAPAGRGGRVRLRTGMLKQYLRTHRPRLAQEAAEVRRTAPLLDDEVLLPRSNAAWLTWLQSHEAEFAEAMQKQGPQERRALNQRLTPRVPFPAAPQDTRVMFCCSVLAGGGGFGKAVWAMFLHTPF